MQTLKAILLFLAQALGFYRESRNRRDTRTEKKHQSDAAKEFAKNEEDINKLYPTRSSSDKL